MIAPHGKRCAVMVFLAAALTLATAAQAREGFFIGGSLARQEVHGDLDGSKGFINDTGTSVLLAGHVNPGLGAGVILGYGFNEYVGVEYSWVSTSHTADHNAVGFRSRANVTSRLLAVRATIPIYDLDLYAKAGYGSYTVDYDSFGLEGALDVNNDFVYTDKKPLQFGGKGYGLGVGAELALGPLGLGAGLTYHNASLEDGSGAGQSGVLPKNLDIQIYTVDVTLSYHF